MNDIQLGREVNRYMGIFFTLNELLHTLRNKLIMLSCQELHKKIDATHIRLQLATG